MKQSGMSKKSSTFANAFVFATLGKAVGKSVSNRQSAIGNRQSHGFTLIELMIVVIILAALAGMVMPRLLDRADDAKIGIARGEMASITTALKFYKMDIGRFPTSEEGLSALMVRPSSAGSKWKRPYLEKAPDDPWGRPYHYQVDAGSLVGFKLWSTGPDEASAEDDITNWDER